MSRFVMLLAMLLVPVSGFALNIENAKRLNKTCALCHGIYGQGTPGTLSPRLAGLPASYLAKELEFYRNGTREYAPMVIASSIKSMSDEDIRDISEYLSGVNLKNLNLPKIPKYPNGHAEAGKKIFKDECKGCHRKTGLGKPHKGIPPLAGQYGSYLFGQMKKFQHKDRYHDDDPEDETFDEWKDTELDNIVAYLTELPPHGPLADIGGFTMGANRTPGMISMDADTMHAMAGMLSSEEDRSDLEQGAMKISGQFRVTPTGEIVLTPMNIDTRRIAGLSGSFRITSDGIIFIPEMQTAESSRTEGE